MTQIIYNTFLSDVNRETNCLSIWQEFSWSTFTGNFVLQDAMRSSIFKRDTPTLIYITYNKGQDVKGRDKRVGEIREVTYTFTSCTRSKKIYKSKNWIKDEPTTI